MRKRMPAREKRETEKSGRERAVRCCEVGLLLNCSIDLFNDLKYLFNLKILYFLLYIFLRIGKTLF